MPKLDEQKILEGFKLLQLDKEEERKKISKNSGTKLINRTIEKLDKNELTKGFNNKPIMGEMTNAKLEHLIG
ncbi:MAG: hypothetical protein KGZ58_00260 [Ignavibacteriales bacterium]|nr:hypothetical protein [Ignavibacteriales bacterium]